MPNNCLCSEAPQFLLLITFIYQEVPLRSTLFHLSKLAAMQTKQISKKCYRFNIKSLPTTRNIKHSWPLQRNIHKSHSLYPYDAFKSTNRYRYKLSSFCKLILCSSCTVVCLKIVVWVCDMNPAVYLKWVLTNHPHVSSWSETSLCVAVAGTIPFFISL